MLYQYFRVAVFLVHAVTALFFLVTAFTTGCTTTVTTAFHSAIGPPASPNASYPVVILPPPVPCPALPPGRVLGFPALAPASAWCDAAQPPALFERAESIQSFVVGSSWNVLILILMFEWVTSSYALLYLEEPVALWALVPAPPGVHPVPFVATVWNMVLLVLLWFYRATFLLPDNNLFLFSFLLCATMIMQNYIARSADGEAPATLAPASGSHVGADARVTVHEPFVWRTDHFLRQRTTTTTIPLGRSLQAPAAKYTPLGVEVGAPAVPLHQKDYATNLDLKGEAVSARMMEYSCTAPLLLVGLYLNFTTTALTWTYQLLFVALCVCNGIGIPLHLSVLLLRTASPADRPKLQAAGWLLLVASWIAFASGFAVYLYTASFVLTNADAGAPTWVVGLLWVVLLFYSLFGVVVTYYYTPRLIWPTPTADVAKGGAADRDPWLADFDMVVLWLDIFSVVIKLTVAWTVYSKGAIVNCAETGCI